MTRAIFEPAASSAAPSLTIRQATSADAATVLRLVQALAAYEREPEAVVGTEADFRAQLSEPSPPFSCLLAEQGGRAVAFALYFFAYSTWRGRRVLHLEDLFVDARERGHGVGRALMGALARVALERDCARLEWSVLDWNVDAWRFYERLGATTRDGWTVFRLSDESLRAVSAC